MFDVISDRLPRAPRRQLDADEIDRIDSLARFISMTGANTRTRMRDASNDELRTQIALPRAA